MLKNKKNIKNIKNQLGFSMLECLIMIITFLAMVIGGISFSYYLYSPISNEEILKIKDTCVINELKNKLNLTEKNNNALTGRNLERIKDFCKIKNEKESYSNQQIIKNQKELLNIKSNTNEYDEQGYF